MDKRIDHIDSQFERVLANHEKDFVQAYRVSAFYFSIILYFLGPYDTRQERTQVPQAQSARGRWQADQRPCCH